jgi:hypothetical protein
MAEAQPTNISMVPEAPFNDPGKIGPSVTQWRAAEFLDVPYADDVVIRGLICRLPEGRKWQWSVIVLDSGRAELVDAGTEKSLAAARQTAASEIEKCISSPLS